MGIPNGQFSKFVISGPISTLDTWSCSTWWQSLAGVIPTDSTAQQLCDGLTNTFISMFWNPATSPYKAVNAAGTKVAKGQLFVYTDGALTDEATTTPTAVIGTAGNAQPAFCSQVFSLRTAAFGRSARGRIYLPRTGVANDATTLMYTNTQAHVDNLAAWLGQEFPGSPNLGVGPVVMSQVHTIARPITRVIMDNKPDTQRGRENKAAATSVMSAAVS